MKIRATICLIFYSFSDNLMESELLLKPYLKPPFRK